MAQAKSWTYRKPVLIGVTAALFLVGGVGAWATQVHIAGAVIGQGRIEVDTSRQLVQHVKGGVVAEILATDGDHVEAGDILLRLDDSGLRTQLKTIDGELSEVLAREARLNTEIDGGTELDLDPQLAGRMRTDTLTAEAVARHSRLLASGLTVLEQQLDLIHKKIAQIENQVVAVEAQQRAKEDQIALVEADLTNAESLISRQLIKLSDVSDLRKDRSRLIGEAGSLAANKAELGEKVVELELELLSLPVNRRKLAMEELSKLKPDKVKLVERRVELTEELEQLDVRSPVTGIVHDSQVHGLRSVVVEATPIMSIIPADRPAIAVVRIDAGDIDQVHAGQPTALRFSSFNRRATPLVDGTVVAVSPDAFMDAATRTYYYEARISFSRDNLEGIDGKLLVPGMPVEAFFATIDQTPFTYVTKPLVDYFNRAYRDS